MIGGCDPCCGGSAPCDLGECGYSLADFADAEITDVTLVASGGTAATVAFDSVQDTDVGLVAPSRKLTVEQSGTATDDTRGYAIVFPINSIWTPNSMCSIDSVTYCVNALLDEGATIDGELLLVCRQGGELYVRDRAHLLTTEWKRFRGTCGEEDFDHLDSGEFAPDATTHPDFSVEGDPVQFGVAFRGTIDQGAADLVGVAWVDNLCVSVSRGTDCGVCEHAECHGGQYAVTLQGFVMNSYAGSDPLILAARSQIEAHFTSTLICNTSMTETGTVAAFCTYDECGCQSSLIVDYPIVISGTTWTLRCIVQFHIGAGTGDLLIGLSFGLFHDSTNYAVAQCMPYDAVGTVFPDLVLAPSDDPVGYFNSSPSGTVLSNYGWTFDTITLTPLP